jgi:arsenite oxidase small subunit
MSDNSGFSRRGFVRLCASAIAMFGASPATLLAQQGPMTARRYARVRLVDDFDRPITAAQVRASESYLFFYPYAVTPCFLVNLGATAAKPVALQTRDGDSYVWPGGVGPARSIVAFSAICAHKMSYPARAASFINYRRDKASFDDKDGFPEERKQVIYCCSEKSVYDATQGARVLGGPAPQPLAAILLDYDQHEDALYATGTCGGEMFERFFTQFGFRLALDFGTSDIREPVSGTARVTTVAAYCRNPIYCG